MVNLVKRSIVIGNRLSRKVPPQHVRLWVSPKWIQKHIHGFRGDLKVVTIGGNGAGSFSTEAHLNAVPESDAEGLFNRAIMRSGTLGD